MANDYLDAFARESEEQITRLNNALLDFENDPSDESAMEDIFRTAHTLKGNCGAMGFDAAEDLAHAIEDLLEEIRAGRVSVTTEVMDAVFDGVDELEAMIDEAVTHGSIDREADAVIDALRDHAAVQGPTPPSDGDVDDLLSVADAPSDAEYSVYHVRLAVAGDPAVHGRAVIDALDDAFQLMATDPDGEAVDAGDYGGTLDAVFASVVETAAVEAALDPVEAVDDQLITEVTDRVEDATDDGDGEAASATPDAESDESGVAAAADLSVDELLEEEDVDQFDDLDEMAEEIEDASEFDDLGDAGSFADLGLTEDDVDVEAGSAAAEAGDAAADASDEAAAGDAAEEPADDDEVEDAAAEFAKLKEEVDPVGFDELQEELADLEFDEYDSDEEVGFDELLEDDELAAEGAFGDAASEPADASAADTSADDAAADPDATAEADVEGTSADASGADDATADVLFGEDTEPDAEAEDVEADAAEAAAEPAAEADVAETDADGAEAVEADAGDAVDADASDTVDADAGGAAETDAGGAVEAEPDAGAADADLEADEAAEPADEPAPADEVAAESFGEGGIDLSESDDDAAEEPATDAGEAGTEPAVDLGEDDIDFGEGSVPAAESDEPAAEDAPVETGDALDDDSFGDVEATDAADAAAADEPVADVEGFGEEGSVLDLDSGTSAGADTADGEAATADDAAVEAGEADVADAGAGVGADGTAADDPVSDGEFGDGPDDAPATDAGGAIDDPGFSDAPESAADDGPEVDEERLERIRGLGVPELGDEAGGGGVGGQSIRVDVAQLDRMLNMVEGLVTSRARLRRAMLENEPRDVLEEELDDLEDVTSELQDTVMDVRLVPLRTAVNKLPRIVRDVAREQDKRVDFSMEGEDVEIDRSILDEIGDPLVHLVRNAVDHGIESPDEREDADKPEEGSVELRAVRERDRVLVTVEDDGRGIDAAAVRDAAVEQGIRTRSEVEDLPDEEVYDLIFQAGFSTAEEVTDVSGRGVGMDVVAETVDRLDGSVRVDSEPGEGTTIEMELPVSLAIAEVLFVEVGGEEYGIPIKVVDEIGPVIGVETQDGQEVLVSDGGEDRRELLRLDEELGTSQQSDPNRGMLIHLREEVREAAIHCDEVREQQEVVVKPFEGVLGDVPGLGGATVLGDGDVVNILDVETL